MSSYRYDHNEYLYNPEPALPLRILVQAGVPVDLTIIDEAEMRRPKTKKERDFLAKLEKQAARKRKRKEADAKLKEHIRTLLDRAGVDGLPEGEELGYPRSWNSKRPFDPSPHTGFTAFHHACFGWDDNPLDPNAREEAEAALEGWRGVRGVSCVRMAVSDDQGYPTYDCGDQRATYRLDEDQPQKSKHKVTKPAAQETVHLPPYSSVAAAFTEAVSEPVTNQSLNAAAAAWVLNPKGERAHLAILIRQHLEKTYLNQCKRILGDRTSVYEPVDLLLGLLDSLLLILDAGKYEHQGKMQNWIGRCWKSYRSDFQKTFYEEKNATQYGADLCVKVDGEEIGSDFLSPFDGFDVNSHLVGRLEANRKLNLRIADEVQDFSNSGSQMLSILGQGLKKGEADAASGLHAKQGQRIRRKFKSRLTESKKEAA